MPITLFISRSSSSTNTFLHRRQWQRLSFLSATLFIHFPKNGGWHNNKRFSLFAPRCFALSRVSKRPLTFIYILHKQADLLDCITTEPTNLTSFLRQRTRIQLCGFGEMSKWKNPRLRYSSGSPGRLGGIERPSKITELRSIAVIIRTAAKSSFGRCLSPVSQHLGTYSLMIIFFISSLSFYSNTG